MTPEERLRGLPPEEIFKVFPAEERLRGLSTEEIFGGFTAEQIEAYLKKLRKKPASVKKKAAKSKKSA